MQKAEKGEGNIGVIIVLNSAVQKELMSTVSFKQT